MKLFFLLPLALLSNICHALDEDFFPLSQCECPDEAFSPISTGTAIVGDISLNDASCEESDTGFTNPLDDADTSPSLDFEADTTLTDLMFVVELEGIAGTDDASVELFSFSGDGDLAIDFQAFAEGGGSGLNALLFVELLAGEDEDFNGFIVVGQTNDFFYQCHSLVDTISFTCATDDIETDEFSTLSLLQGTDQDLSLSIRRFFAFSDVIAELDSGLEADIASDLDSFFAANIDTRTVLPILSIDTSSGTEDTDQELDMTDFFSGGQNFGTLEFDFTFDDESRISDDDELDSGIFTFTPDENSFADVSIEFEYGISSPYECFLTETFTLEFEEVDDAPVAVDDVSIEANAGLENVFNILVAQSVDEEEDGEAVALPSGTLSSLVLESDDVDDVGTLLDVDCETEVTTLTIADGNVSFCIIASTDLSDGTSATLSFTIEEDEGDLTTDSSIEISGSNPVSVNEVSDAVSLDEDEADTFSFNDDELNLVTVSDPTVDDEDITIVIDSLPSNGVLSVDGTDLEVDDEIAFDAVVTYTPNANYFNTDEDTTGTDDAGDFFDSSCSVTRVSEDICPDTFSFSTNVGGLLSSGGIVGFLVFADDDANPSLETTSATIQNVNGDDDINGLAQTTLSGFSVSNDEGSNAFAVDLVISTSGEVAFIVDLDSTTSSVELSDDSCAASTCSEVTITGIPSVLETIINTQLDVRVPIDAEAVITSITLQVENGNDDSESVTVEFGIVFGEASFFDNEVNLIIVIVGPIVVLAIVAGFGIYRVTRKAKLEEKDMEGEADRKATLAHRKEQERRRAKQQAVRTDAAEEPEERAAPIHDKQKSLRLDADHAIFDYEKHVDPETGDSYFFNPKTGHTTWDPPTIKDYQI